MALSPPRFAWVLNQDAELELSRPGYTPAARTLLQIDQYGAHARALLGPRDILVTDLSSQPGPFLGRAWCPTPLAVAKLRAIGVAPEPHPTPETLRLVNHRHFAFDLAAGLPGQRYVSTRQQLQSVLQAGRSWLLKRPLGFAGRGQLRILGGIDPKQAAWIDASLRHDGLIVEPLITPVLEISLHGFVWRDKRFDLGRACVQDVSERGVFRAVRLAKDRELDESEHQSLFTQGDRVANALGRAGYFGPFGIDAYRYDLDGSIGFCALSEINARYTMGFVTGFPRHPSQLSL